MKILVALDTTSQGDFLVQEVARLAGNTWADVTLLGIEPEETQNERRLNATDRIAEDHPLVQALRKHRDCFLVHLPEEASPYAQTNCSFELVGEGKGLWEDLKVCRGRHKQLLTRIRPGNPAKAVLAEVRQDPCDLIVIGSDAAAAGSEIGRPARKVIREADTTVLVVAEAKQPRRIVACLDHDQVSQPSLEMINQMVTLYQADLEIVGLTTSGGLPDEVDSKMGQILKYYAANGIKALVRLVSETSLQAFAEERARENLVALWMGRQSLLRRFIPPRSLDRILTSADSSVLILR
ncbi:MAG: universal stress protein [Desulfohalobiaceae bacterium]|nr:universal stress protein [Desulfohalobiaceae bacterium]